MVANIGDVRALMTAHDALAERVADADRDYADMRRFQARYIEADQARRALIVDVQRLRDALKPFAAIVLTTKQAVDPMDVLRARGALKGGE